MMLKQKKFLKNGIVSCKLGEIKTSVPDFDALIKVYKLTNNLGRITGPLYGRWEMKIQSFIIKLLYP